MHRTPPIRKLLVALASCSLAAVAFASPASAGADRGNDETRTADVLARSNEPDRGGRPESAGQPDKADRAGKPDRPDDAPASTAASHETQGTAATNGSPSEPQPASNADYTDNGANTHGSYDSTRDGSPSGNGNGNGAATGKPCAGCVGAADNKNPAGQYPDGTDHNAGYECDRNHGIGRTNPAHTGCTEADAVLGIATVDVDVDVDADADEATVLAPGTGRVCSADAATHAGGACATASTSVVPICPTGAVMADPGAAICVAAAVSGICPSGTAMTGDATCAGPPACPSSTTMAAGTCVARAQPAPGCAVTGGMPSLGTGACVEGHIAAFAVRIDAEPDTETAIVATPAPESVRVHAVSAGRGRVATFALAVTGASIMSLLVVAGIALAGGLMLVVASRRTRTA